MLYFGSAALISILNLQYSYLAFFALAYLFIFANNFSLVFALLVGLIVDTYYAFPYGFTTGNYLVFLLFLNLYQWRYNKVNQKFLLIMLLISSFIWNKINNLFFSEWQVLFFGFYYFTLAIILKKRREKEIKMVE